MAFNPLQVGDKLIAVGQKLNSTGDKLKTTSVKINSVADAFLPAGTLVQSITSIKQGAVSIRTLLNPVSTALTFIGTTLNNIEIPTVAFTLKTLEIAFVKFTFVSGITMGKIKPFSSIATKVNTVLTNVNNIRETLLTTSTAITNLIASFPFIRNDIRSGATDLASAGDVMKESGTFINDAGNLIKI